MPIEEDAKARLDIVSEAMSRACEGLEAGRFSIGKLIVCCGLAAEAVRLMTSEQIAELVQPPSKSE
jgi:hypothetical protein